MQQFANAGVTFAEPPAPEVVAERWAEITDMTGAVAGVNPVG